MVVLQAIKLCKYAFMFQHFPYENYLDSNTIIAYTATFLSTSKKYKNCKLTVSLFVQNQSLPLECIKVHRPRIFTIQMMKWKKHSQKMGKFDYTKFY